jgi:hypothetical protein
MEEKAVERVAEIACDRYQDEIGVDTMRWKGINDTMRGYWRAIARAVLSAVPSYADGLRPEVLAFAVAMETRLRANDHKGGWGSCSAAHLLSRVADEFKELKRAVGDLNGGDILHEAADVANFAMMVADVCGALAPAAAIPSYAQGWDDAKRRAVEKVEELLDWPEAFNDGPHDAIRKDKALAAIRAIEPEMGTHEARWAAAGWPFAWDDDVRAYVCPVGEITGLPSLPTVQAVDAWIGTHGKGE